VLFGLFEILIDALRTWGSFHKDIIMKNKELVIDDKLYNFYMIVIFTPNLLFMVYCKGEKWVGP